MKKIILGLLVGLFFALPVNTQAFTQRTVYYRLGKVVPGGDIQRTIDRAPYSQISEVSDYGLPFRTFFIHDFRGGSRIHSLVAGDRICLYTHLLRNRRQNEKCYTIKFATQRVLAQNQDDAGRVALQNMISAYKAGKGTSFLMSCYGTGRKVIGW